MLVIFFTYIIFVSNTQEQNCSAGDPSCRQDQTCADDDQSCSQDQASKKYKAYCYESIDHGQVSKLIFTFNKEEKVPPLFLKMIYRINNDHGSAEWVYLDKHDQTICFKRTDKTCNSTFRITGTGRRDVVFNFLTGNTINYFTRMRIKFDEHAEDGRYDVTDGNKLFTAQVQLERNGHGYPAHQKEYAIGQVEEDFEGNILNICAVNRINAYDLKISFPQNDNWKKSYFKQITGIEILCYGTQSQDDVLILHAWICPTNTYSPPLTIVYPCSRDMVRMRLLYEEYDGDTNSFTEISITQTWTALEDQLSESYQLYNAELYPYSTYKADQKVNEALRAFVMDSGHQIGTCPQYGQKEVIKITFNYQPTTDKNSIEKFMAYLWVVNVESHPSRHFSIYNFKYFNSESGCNFPQRKRR